MGKIYIIRQIIDLEDNKFFGRKTLPTGHAYAYMTDIDDAHRYIINNAGDIHECGYFKYAAIDTYKTDICNATSLERIVYKLREDDIEDYVYEEMSEEETKELLKGICY